MTLFQRLRFTVLALVFAAPVVLASTASTPDEAALARVPLENYLKGHATGDGAYMRLAFLPTAHIEGVRDGKFTSWTADEYISRFTGKPAADEAQRTRRIDAIDITGQCRHRPRDPDLPECRRHRLFRVAEGGWRVEDRQQGVQLAPRSSAANNWRSFAEIQPPNTDHRRSPSACRR